MTCFTGCKSLGNDLYEMHGRQVMIYDRKGTPEPCSDCHSLTTIEVMEKPNGDWWTWPWCGFCDIGG